MMKRNILLLTFMLIALAVSAQKAERKAIRKGNESYKEQLYGNAEEEYKKATEVNPASKEASFNLANTYYRQQRWDEAIKEYQHYLTLEQQNLTKMSSAWANQGNTYLKKKANEQGQQPPAQKGQQQAPDNLAMAMESYKMALRLNPTDEEVRYNLAVVQKLIQDQQQQGGESDEKKDEKKENKEDKQDKQDKQKEDKQDQENKSQMSQDNVEQILKALEQEEKETQERVKQAKAMERKRQNQHNRRQNKDW